jgi:predicted DNA-binding transcriptional regulator AlpA
MLRANHPPKSRPCSREGRTAALTRDSARNGHAAWAWPLVSVEVPSQAANSEGPLPLDTLLPDEALDRIADALWAKMVGSNCDPVDLNLRAKLAIETRLLGSERAPFGLDKLSCEETASYLGVQAETLRDRAKRRALGLPEPYHIGRKLHWRRSDLDPWIESKRERRFLDDADPKHGSSHFQLAR